MDSDGQKNSIPIQSPRSKQGIKGIFVITSFCGHLMYIETLLKSCEMKHEMTLFHTMGPDKNVLFQTHLLFVTIYGLMWGSFNIR